MRPEKGDTFINIPVTFDKQSKGRILTKAKFLWSALIFGCCLFICIMVWIAGDTSAKILTPTISLIIWSLTTRFILLRERYFKKKREELKSHDYKFNSDVFWKINSIDEAYPYFVRFSSGVVGLFVVFDKDVIVGRPDDNEFYHYEFIADAYQEMMKRNISCMHIDYMDVCGKDDRMEELFHVAARTENEDLRLALTRFYDNIEWVMNRAYASYDVYCFYSNQRVDLFWDDIQGVISILNRANFVRSRVLDREEIGKLVKSLFNMDDFSMAQACESIYKDQMSNYLKVIWTECDGKRTIINKTTAEIEEAKKVMMAERNLKRVKTKPQKLKKGEIPVDDRISLWGDPLPPEEIKLTKQQLKYQEKLKKQEIKKQQKDSKNKDKVNKGDNSKVSKRGNKVEGDKTDNNTDKVVSQGTVTNNVTNKVVNPEVSQVVRKPKIKSRGNTVDNDENINLFD